MQDFDAWLRAYSRALYRCSLEKHMTRILRDSGKISIRGVPLDMQELKTAFYFSTPGADADLGKIYVFGVMGNLRTSYQFFHAKVVSLKKLLLDYVYKKKQTVFAGGEKSRRKEPSEAPSKQRLYPPKAPSVRQGRPENQSKSA